MPVSEPTEHQGYWFLPEKPENKVPGRLVFDVDNGASLELIGSLSETPLPGGDFAPPVILGMSTTKAVPITLLDCVETASQLSSSRFGGMVTSKLRPVFTLVGAHFTSRDLVALDEAFLRFDNLEQWAAMPGIDITFDSSGNSEVRYQRPQDVSLANFADVEMDLVTWPTFPSLQMVQTEARISHRVSIRVRPEEPATLERFVELAGQMQQLLTLLIGDIVTLTSIDGRSMSVAVTLDDGTISKSPIDVLFQMASRGGRRVGRRILPVEMVLPRTAVGDDLTSLVNTWLESQEVLKPAYDLFFGTLFNSGMYLDQEFLALTQAVESLHRRTYATGPADEHRTRLARILGSQTDDDKKWLAEELRYSHEPSLRKRLRELIGESPEILPYLGHKPKFIQDVVVTRNYLTHYDESLESDALKSDAMFYATHKLRGLLMVTILHRLGIGSDRTERMLQGNSRAAKYLRLAVKRAP